VGYPDGILVEGDEQTCTWLLQYITKEESCREHEPSGNDLQQWDQMGIGKGFLADIDLHLFDGPFACFCAVK
jgi:hypothetical protein